MDQSQRGCELGKRSFALRRYGRSRRVCCAIGVFRLSCFSERGGHDLQSHTGDRVSAFSGSFRFFRSGSANFGRVCSALDDLVRRCGARSAGYRRGTAEAATVIGRGTGIVFCFHTTICSDDSTAHLGRRGTRGRVGRLSGLSDGTQPFLKIGRGSEEVLAMVALTDKESSLDETHEIAARCPVCYPKLGSMPDDGELGL